MSLFALASGNLVAEPRRAAASTYRPDRMTGDPEPQHEDSVNLWPENSP
jgi:hypothetical protein